MLYRNLFDEYQHRKGIIKSMKKQLDNLRIAKQQQPSESGDRLVVLEAQIGKIYELLPSDFKFPETTDLKKKYIGIEDGSAKKKANPKPVVQDKFNYRPHYEPQEEPTNYTMGYNSKSSSPETRNYTTYEDENYYKEESQVLKKKVSKRTKSPPQEQPKSYSNLYDHGKEVHKLTEKSGKKPRLHESKKSNPKEVK